MPKASDISHEAKRLHVMIRIENNLTLTGAHAGSGVDCYQPNKHRPSRQEQIHTKRKGINDAS